MSSGSNISLLDIHELLPQKEPFIMVSQLEHLEKGRVISSLKIDPENFFVHDGHFETIGLVENIAQTCALRQGYIGKCNGKHEIKIGVIGGINNLVISCQPHIGDTITTEVTVTAELGEYLMVHAIVNRQGCTIMEADVKLKI